MGNLVPTKNLSTSQLSDLYLIKENVAESQSKECL